MDNVVMNEAASVSWVGLGGVLIFLIFALMAVGAIVMLVALLARERTRRLGLAILAVLGVGLGFMVIVFVGILVLSYRPTVHREAVLEEQARALAKAIPRESGEMSYDIQLSDSSDDENSDEDDEETTEGEEHTTASTSRPAWVETPSKRVGDNFQVAVASGPYTTRRECDEHIDRLITIETAEYLDKLLGERRFARHDTDWEPQQYSWASTELSRLDITPLFIRKNICSKEFDEVVASSVGPMHKVHVLMEFNKDVEIELRGKWEESQIEERLMMVGVGAAMLLSLVGLVFAYLKFDTVTQGFYTRRLQVVATVVTIILIVALFAALA